MTSIDRRTLLISMPAAAITTATLTGCGAGPIVAANPVTQQMLIGLASSLGATLLVNVGDDAVTEIEKQWANGFNATLTRDLVDCSFFPQSYASPDGARILLTEYVRGTTTDVASEPLVRGCAITIGAEGKEAVALPSWAYQTLAAFTKNYLEDRDGVSRYEGEALMATALAPTSSKAHEGASLAGSVKFLSYTTARGPVDLSLWEQEDHSYSGRIKVSGLPDETGESLIWECEVPNAPAEEQSTLKLIDT